MRTSTSDAHPTSLKHQRINDKRQGSNPMFKDAHFQKHRASTQAQATSIRFAVYFFYIHHLDAPHEEHWSGREGTVSQIRKLLGLPPHTQKKIRRALEHIMLCIRSGQSFDGIYKNNAGLHVLINHGSFEE